MLAMQLERVTILLGPSCFTAWNVTVAPKVGYPAPCTSCCACWNVFKGVLTVCRRVLGLCEEAAQSTEGGCSSKGEEGSFEGDWPEDSPL